MEFGTLFLSGEVAIKKEFVDLPQILPTSASEFNGRAL
jgi:hypothetical protein